MDKPDLWIPPCYFEQDYARKEGYERYVHESKIAELKAKLDIYWQPIETAPKDGSKVLLFACGHCVEAVWGDGNGAYNNPCWIPTHAGGIYSQSVTHWMPLPEPPSSLAQIEDK